jgi:hypothetical protein
MDIHEFASLGNKALIAKYGKDWMRELSKKGVAARQAKRKINKLPIDKPASR